MLWKAIKMAAVGVTGAAVLGGIVFGSDLASYVCSSRNSVASAVRDNIPLDFQIRRAKDLLAASEPEMHRNIRLMAEEEVDIALLQKDIGRSEQSLEKEKTRLATLRTELAGGGSSFTVGECTYSRDQMLQELSRRLRFYDEGQAVLAQKRQLLGNRQMALAAAGRAMDEAKEKRAVLTAQVEALAGRERLLAATCSAGDVRFDSGKLTQAEQVVAQVQRQLDVAEHAAAREAKFVDTDAQVDAVNEKELLGEVDETLGTAKLAAGPGALSRATK